MPRDLAAEIRSEIQKIEQQMAEQRHIVCQNVGNIPVLEAAESKLKALETRRTTLKGNLNKLF
jgi:hypothetical protein